MSGAFNWVTLVAILETTRSFAGFAAAIELTEARPERKRVGELVAIQFLLEQASHEA